MLMRYFPEMGFAQESDTKRVSRLCNEVAETSRAAVENIPVSIPRSELRFEQIFDHGMIGKISNIMSFAKWIDRNTGDNEKYWQLIKSSARKCIFNINTNFVSVSEEKEGIDLGSAFALITSSASCELEIEEDRRALVKEFGEEHELVKDYDSRLNEINEIEQQAIELLPTSLQPMFRIRKNLDEIVQLAERNIEVEPEKAWKR